MPRDTLSVREYDTVEALLAAMRSENKDVLPNAFRKKFGSADRLRQAGELHLARSNDDGSGEVVLRVGPAPSGVA
jgi:hypothetical protein